MATNQPSAEKISFNQCSDISKLAGAAVIAVGAQAKKTFREKGEKPFVTSLIRYYGWIYHPESMNRVSVTDLVRLRRSDGVMAKFLSRLIVRVVVYYYAEFRCNKKFTEAEREAIHGLIGQVGKQCAAIMKIIWNYRESDSDYELKTRLEIFREIKSSLKDQFVVGAFTACEKQLVLSEEADSIEEIVNDEYHRHMNEGNLTKRACFDAIKDDLLSSFNDKAKNVYSRRLAFEEERDDQKMIFGMLARAKMEAKAERVELDTDAFFEQLREKHPFKGSAIKFVKHNSDCQTISEQLARAKMEAKAERVELDTDAFFEQLRVQHPDKGDAINFVAGREKSYSVLSKRKSMLAWVDKSVKKEAKARSVEECKIDCSIYKCIECSEKRSEEYSEFHYAVAADLGKDKPVTCLLCKKQKYISTNFRRVRSISVEGVREERDKLDQQSKQEKKPKKSKSKKSAPKRKVEVATSPTSKKRKSSDQANSEGLADGNAVRSGGPDDDQSCSDCCYHPGRGKWKLRIRKGELKGAYFHLSPPPQVG